MKKIAYTLISLLITCIISIILFELTLHLIPFIYKKIPVSQYKTYIYVLGESTAAGYPYNRKINGDISYHKILKYIFNNKIDYKDIEIIDLSKPGCQLYQQYMQYFLYKYLHPFHKGIIILYIGTNDWNNGHGYNSFTKNILLNIKLFQPLLGYVCRPFDFEYEYEKIILLAKNFGDDVYMSTIAGNYAGFIPNKTQSLKKTKFNNLIKEIDKKILNKEYNTAMDLCKKLLKLKADRSQIWYRIGKIYEKQKKITQANYSYLNAIDYGFDDRPTRYQNDVIRKLAVKYNIPLTDFFNELYNSGEVIGFNFFLDTIHPNIKSHMLIAYGFADLLKKKYKVELLMDIDEHDVRQEFNFDNNEVLKLSMYVISELLTIYYTTNEMTDKIFARKLINWKYNIIFAKEWIKKIKLIDIDNTKRPNNYDRNEFIAICQLVFACIDYDRYDEDVDKLIIRLKKFMV